MNGIFGNNLSLSETCLDSLWARQTTTLHNIANADTPGFKAQYVSFEDELRRKLTAVKKAAPHQMSQAITSSRYFVHDSREESARMDGNNVNVDVENVELVRTSLQYQYELNALNGDISRLRAALRA